MKTTLEGFWEFEESETLRFSETYNKFKAVSYYRNSIAATTTTRDTDDNIPPKQEK